MPEDLPDLLRLACSHGMRVNVWHTARGDFRGYQANLANAGNGWTIETDVDPLEAIAKVLRTRYGPMRERQRAAAASSSAAKPKQIDIEEAIAAASVEDLIG